MAIRSVLPVLLAGMVLVDSASAAEFFPGTISPIGVPPARAHLYVYDPERSGPCGYARNINVIIMVPPSVDLRDETWARAYVLEGIKFYNTHCVPRIKQVCENNGMQLVRCEMPNATIYVGYQDTTIEPTIGSLREGAVQVEAVTQRATVLAPSSGFYDTSYRNNARIRWLPHEADREVIRAAEAAGGGQAVSMYGSRSSARAQYSIRVPAEDPNVCKKMQPTYSVVADIPPGIDLGDNKIAGAYVAAGLGYGITYCDDREGREGYPERKLRLEGGPRAWAISVHLQQASVEKVRASWVSTRDAGRVPLTQLARYENFVAAQRLAEEKARQEAERDKQEAANREAALRPIRERRVAFIQKHKVTRAVSCHELARNPYAFEGQIVAVYGTFDSMTARDRGTFKFGDCTFVVSSIPAATFGAKERQVLVAGRVIGQTEVKKPVIGPVQAAHLTFVGVHLCQEAQCGDILEP